MWKDFALTLYCHLFLCDSRNNCLSSLLMNNLSAFAFKMLLLINWLCFVELIHVVEVTDPEIKELPNILYPRY